MSAEFETNITSAERIEEYCNTPQEVISNSFSENILFYFIFY